MVAVVTVTPGSNGIGSDVGGGDVVMVVVMLVVRGGINYVYACNY